MDSFGSSSILRSTAAQNQTFLECSCFLTSGNFFQKHPNFAVALSRFQGMYPEIFNKIGSIVYKRHKCTLAPTAKGILFSSILICSETASRPVRNWRRLQNNVNPISLQVWNTRYHVRKEKLSLEIYNEAKAFGWYNWHMSLNQSYVCVWWTEMGNTFSCYWRNVRKNLKYPSNYYHFTYLKLHMGWKGCSNDEEVKKWTKSLTSNFETSIYCVDLRKSLDRLWISCILVKYQCAYAMLCYWISMAKSVLPKWGYLVSMGHGFLPGNDKILIVD